MRRIISWQGATPSRQRPGQGVVEVPRGLIGVVRCATLCLGCVILDAPSSGGSSLSTTGISFWACIFGTSAGVRVLAQASFDSGARLAVPRMVCATYGLMAWSQLSWTMLQPALARLDASTWGAVVGCGAAYAAVALIQLRAIYKAAQDARSDDP